MSVRYAVLLSLVSSAAFAQPSPFPTIPNDTGKEFMVSATNPYVTSTGYTILKQGGNAIDAMVAMQMVMSVVEPDMTGIGGGTFALYYDNETKSFTAYDGRDAAPASATPDMFLDDNGKAISRNDILGPRSVAIPGTLKLLYETHQKHGKLGWAQLVQPAIDYAENGYAMNSYTYDIVVRESERLVNDPEIKALYWKGETIRPTGTKMTNPKMAKTLKMIAQQGDSYLYQGPLAERIVETVNAQLKDGQAKLTLKDFTDYRMKQRDIIRSNYRGNQIVSFGYPASGGVLVSQSLDMLEKYDISNMTYTSAEPWRLMVEAMRLAKEDRIAYAGDPSYVDTPVKELLAEDYIDDRYELIPEQGAGNKKSIKPGLPPAKTPANHEGFESQDTGHISIIDAQGNAVAMTSTVGTGMGSGVMVDGVLLNAQMANFSSIPSIKGKPVQNSIEPGKRPRSAITPLMMMDDKGQLRLVVGSPGSSQIPGYVLKTIVGIVDWNLPAQDAIDLPNIQYGTKIDRTKPYNPTGLLVEKRTFAESMVPEFAEMGYKVHVIPVVSGLNAIEIKDGELHGATDRRRASTSLGD
ncbi:gamma-glutamyltransferase [Vibrio mediterranei]|uniref:gamma-glutamyltransferase n=1 Tax=Vibrio mediterranei TaxID=689 RepID=UPI001EFEDA7F|nr:gamma-glutamyltransferase [Vibrio mediterranei]MCG9663762.1 gamma-glutamyltransferase [Vibrio mediterranei]